MELWDLLDKDRTPLGITHPRGRQYPMPPRTYHTVVTVFTVDAQKRILLTRRAPTKGMYPNYWEFKIKGKFLQEDEQGNKIVEEETEEGEEEIPEYEYTKYTDDSGSIVYIEFDNGTFFLLNYNDYAVTVEFNGTTYTLETYGGIKVVSGQEPESFSFAKIN